MRLTHSLRPGGLQGPQSPGPHSGSHPSPDELAGAPSRKHSPTPRVESKGTRGDTWAEVSLMASLGCWALFNFPVVLNSVCALPAPIMDGNWMPLGLTSQVPHSLGSPEPSAACHPIPEYLRSHLWEEAESPDLFRMQERMIPHSPVKGKGEAWLGKQKTGLPKGGLGGPQGD